MYLVNKIMFLIFIQKSKFTRRLFGTIHVTCVLKAIKFITSTEKATN